MMVSKSKKNFDVAPAGMKIMNPSLYRQPWTNGVRNPRFKHPNLASNLVFYETSPNMRDVQESQFKTTTHLMHSLGNSKFNVVKPIKREFMVNGNVAERLTRENTKNLKNKSSFELSHSRKAVDTSVDAYSKRNSSMIVQEVSQQPKTPVNIWRYKDSPYSKHEHAGKARPQTAKVKDANVLKQARDTHKAFMEHMKDPSEQQKSPRFPENGHAKPQTNGNFDGTFGPRAQKQQVASPRANGHRQSTDEDVQPSDYRNVVPKTPIKINHSKFATARSPEIVKPEPNSDYHTVILDLQEPAYESKTIRNYSTNDDEYLFDRNLEREEQERHRRFVTNLRRDMRGHQFVQPEDTQKDKIYDQSNERTNGVTLEFSGDPMLKVHTQRRQNRDVLTTR